MYKVLPPTQNEQELGHVRVINDTGEDYLFPASYFEPVILDEEALVATDATITVNVSPLIKAILRAEGLAAPVADIQQRGEQVKAFLPQLWAVTEAILVATPGIEA